MTEPTAREAVEELVELTHEYGQTWVAGRKIAAIARLERAEAERDSLRETLSQVLYTLRDGGELVHMKRQDAAVALIFKAMELEGHDA